MPYKILIVEDNTLLLHTLEDFLSDSGFECMLASSAHEALKACYNHRFDVYLLDVKLPDMSGFTFLKELREAGDTTPAIFATSLNDQENLKQGFEIGADDYIKKPFDLEELLLRIKALIVRTKGSEERWIDIDDTYRLNPKRKRLYRNETEVDMHLKEIELLELLIQNRRKVVTKEMIQMKLWKSSDEANEGSIRVYITNLKKVFGKEAIVNIRGIGYRFEY